MKEIFSKIIHTKISYILIFLISFLTYFQTLFFNYTYLDDDRLIIKNINKISDLNNIPSAFKSDAYFEAKGFSYRPLLTVSLMFDAQITGLNPVGYHLTNIILHSIFSCLLLLLLRTLFKNNYITFVSTIIFSLLPLNVNAVSWIVARNDILAGLFFLIFFLSYLKYKETKKIIYYLINILSYLCALFSKEVALIFLIIPPLYELIIRKNNFKHLFVWHLFLFWLLSDSMFLMLKNEISSGMINNSLFSISNFIFNLQIIPELFLKFIIPYNLTSIPIYDLIKVLTGSILLLIIALILYKYRKFSIKYIIFGFIIFMINLIPSMPVRGDSNMVDYFECRSYVPLIGLIIALSAFFEITDILKSRISKYIIGVILLTDILLIQYYSNQYSSPETFYDSAISSSPQSAMALYLRGNIASDKRNFSDAIKYYSEAIKVKNNYPDPFYNRANTYLKKADTSLAIYDYMQVIRLLPDNPDSYWKLSNIYLSKK